MLQCSMTKSINIELILEDLLADLNNARNHDQLGRLALLAYYDLKGWARQAGKPEIAALAMRMFSQNPCLSKDDLLQNIDQLIATLQLHESGFQRSNVQSGKAPAIYSGAMMRQ
jgi:hypothetical protein